MVSLLDPSGLDCSEFPMKSLALYASPEIHSENTFNSTSFLFEISIPQADFIFGDNFENTSEFLCDSRKVLASDNWSAGCIIYEVWSGESLFGSTEYQKLSKEGPIEIVKADNIEEKFCNLVQNCTMSIQGLQLLISNPTLQNIYRLNG